MERITLRANGKLNFSLDILGKRSDGYHLMDMVMQTVDLYDEIVLRSSETISLSCAGEAHVPVDSSNTMWKAAEAFFREAGLKAGVSMSIKKRIPEKAGMGGGSADAAAVLIGLDQMYETWFSVRTLQRIGLTVGADVPYCIVGGTARVEGVGERVIPVPQMRRGGIVIVKPQTGISTALAFQNFDKSFAQWNRPDNSKLLQAMMLGRLDEMGKFMENVLEQSANSGDVKQARDALLKKNALCARMTGSGSAVFGVFKTPSEAVSCASQLSRDGWEAYAASPAPRCVEIVSIAKE